MDFRNTNLQGLAEVLKCKHDHDDLQCVIDEEVRRMSPRVYHIYRIYKCPAGHYYTLYDREIRISDDTLASLYE